MVDVLALKDDFEYLNDSLESLAYIMTVRIHDSTFGFHNVLNTGRLLSENVPLPFNTTTDEIDLSATNCFNVEITYEAEEANEK